MALPLGALLALLPHGPLAPLGGRRGREREDLHAVVSAVRDSYEPIPAYCYAEGRIELPRQSSVGREDSEQLPLRCKHLHTVARAVAHEDSPLSIHRYGPRYHRA